MRSITTPFVVAPPAGSRVRTRLRPSQQDAVVLRLVGEYLGGLAGADLARRCALGPGADARQAGRETLGRGRRGKRFRRTVAGIPTAQFRDRLAQMAANRGIAVVAIDPGWTSKWGAAHWQWPLQARYPRTQITRHHAACVVLGRRALGLKVRRRSGVPAPHQRMEAAGRLPAGVESYRPGRADTRVRAGQDPPGTRPGSSLELQKTGGGDRTQVGVQVAQDRSVPPVSADRC